MGEFSGISKVDLNEKLLKEAEEEFDIEEFMKNGAKVAEKELSKAVSKIIGTKVSLKVSTKVIRNKTYLYADSEGEIKHSPKIFKSLTCGTFNTETGRGKWWTTINYRYEHFSGGSNGSDICSVWIKQDGKIDAIESRIK